MAYNVHYSFKNSEKLHGCIIWWVRYLLHPKFFSNFYNFLLILVFLLNERLTSEARISQLGNFSPTVLKFFLNVESFVLHLPITKEHFQKNSLWNIIKHEFFVDTLISLFLQFHSLTAKKIFREKLFVNTLIGILH